MSWPITERILPLSSDCQISLKFTPGACVSRVYVLKGDGIVGRCIVGDQLRNGDGGILGNPGQNRDLVSGLDVWEMVAQNPKYQLPWRSLAMMRHGEEIYAMVLGCDWR